MDANLDTCDGKKQFYNLVTKEDHKPPKVRQGDIV